jgi:uncharacterized protein (DUF302 family)
MKQSGSLKVLGAVLGLALSAGVAQAGGASKTYTYDGAFDDAAFGVESAIVDKGLVIDYVSHTGDMLNRTGKDVGSNKPLFEKADIFLFCSAVLSRKVMEADPANIAYCPYKIFVTKRDGKVEIGHPVYPEGPMKEVEALLADISKAASKD